MSISDRRSKTALRISWSQVAKVASREIRMRVLSRAFAVGTVLTILVVVGAVVVPAVLSGKSTQRVGVTMSASSLRQDITRIGGETAIPVQLFSLNTATEGVSELRRGELDIVVSPREVMTLRPVSASLGGALDRLAVALSGGLGLAQVLHSASVQQVPPKAVRLLLAPPPLRRTALLPASTTAGHRAVATFGLIISFVLISLYNGWVLMGVIEEKSTRVIEVLLSVLRPSELLGGKILGIGCVALIQGIALVSSAIIASISTTASLIKSTNLWIIVVFLTASLLGYAVYSVLSGALGALVSRIEDAQSVSIVIQLPLLIGYLAGFAALSGSSSLLIKILAYFPLTAPMISPVLYASGNLALSGLLVAFLSTVMGTGVLAIFGARLYAGAVMKIGARVRIKDALRQRA